MTCTADSYGKTILADLRRTHDRVRTRIGILELYYGRLPAGEPKAEGRLRLNDIRRTYRAFQSTLDEAIEDWAEVKGVKK